MKDISTILKDYEKWLSQSELSENTITVYLYAAQYYMTKYNGVITKTKLKQYKKELIENYKPNTANARIHAINKFLEFSNKKSLSLKTIKLQNCYYLDNVISNAELHKFEKRLQENNKINYYMLVRTLVCTGARIGEAVRFQVEDVEFGYAEMICKGGKMRRIYFPEQLRDELMGWLKDEGRSSGPVFLNKNGVTISIRGIESMLRRYATKYGINPDVVHPHSFRHRYALNFLKRKPKEIIALADIMGHSSINTTRIYTRLTSNEQYCLINSVVNW